jgi:hypothetical protein
MDGLDIVKKLRAQLDANGYKDVDLKLIGDVPWSRGSSNDTDISHARVAASQKYLDAVGLGGGGRGGQALPLPNAPGPATATAPPRTSAYYSNGMGNDLDETTATGHGGYWPSYLFSDGEVGQKVGTIKIPMGMGGGGGGGGGRIHAANEYFTVESINKGGGMATAEKSVAAILYEYAQTNTTPPKPKKAAAK